MTLTLADLYASPDHYLHSFDGDAAVFVPMDRAAYHRSIFLDARISPAGEGALRLPIGTLTQAVPTPAATGWIMHVAHCGSTLLARALDDIDGNLVLREPQALRQLAFAAAGVRLDVTTAMLSKRYRPDLPTIVKGNVPTNFLLPRMIAADPAARMILLHLPLRDYLLAILRSENHRAWLRNVTTQLAVHIGPLADASDAERAAALWLAQMRLFADTAATSGTVRSLDAELFFAEPHAVLTAVAGHLGASLTQDEIEARVRGPLFATYSKNPTVSFDNDQRLARRQGLERDLAPELDEAERWIAERQDHVAAATAAVAAIALSV